LLNPVGRDRDQYLSGEGGGCVMPVLSWVMFRTLCERAIHIPTKIGTRWP